MAKVQIKSEKLTPFGGILSIMEKFGSVNRAVPQVQFTLPLCVNLTYLPFFC